MVRAQSDWIVRKRDGRCVPFERKFIERAMANAFRAELNLPAETPLASDLAATVADLTRDVAEQIAPQSEGQQGLGVEADLAQGVLHALCNA